MEENKEGAGRDEAEGAEGTTKSLCGLVIDLKMEVERSGSTKKS